MSERWTLEQLTLLLEKALETVDCASQRSGRVRALPDTRTIRYYTTLGLLDPPSEMRGRKAFYGRRHLLQLVAIKRLQHRGLALAEIQRALVGIGPADLERLAGLSSEFWGCVEEVALPSRPFTVEELLSSQALSPDRTDRQSRSSERFWSQTPTLNESAESALDGHDKPEAAHWALHVPVGEGVEFVLRGIDPSRLDREASARLQEVVEKIAEELRALRLTSPPSSRRDEDGQ